VGATAGALETAARAERQRVTLVYRPLAHGGGGDGPVYVSCDVGCLDPVFAPGTGTPEVSGLITRAAIELLRRLAGLDVIGGDVVEVASKYDATATTAQTGGADAVRHPVPRRRRVRQQRG
jgi:arginase family enzyme